MVKSQLFFRKLVQELEIFATGIRMALGAQRGAVVRMILGEVLGLTAVGVVIGAGTALATSQFVQSLLYGIQHNDPRAHALAVVTLVGAVLLAGYVPAGRHLESIP